MSAKMNLADFFTYARDNRKRMDDTYREIEEIQYQFNELYARQSQERQKLVASLIPLLIAGSADLPPEIAQPLESREQAERKALRDELAALRAEETDKRQKVDNLVLEAQRQVTHLREENPILNQQEEGLKARHAAMRQELQRLDAEIAGLHLFPIGWLTNAGKRKRLSAERQRLVENLNAMTEGIRTVRAKWQEEKKALGESQASLRNQWQAMSVETAQVQTKAEYLAANLDALGKRNAAQNWLNGLRDSPVASGVWKDQLAPLVELNRSRADYEAGLKSVSEILGLLKGLGEGMDRFIRSLGTVYEEQRRYKLPMLSVELSDAVTSLHASWPDTQAKVKDEKYLGTHPLEFSQRVQSVIQERLSEAAIQKMFEDMGEALNKATKAWH
jgi:hypothetical protein